LIFNLIVVAIYVGLAFLTRKAPMTAVIIALVLFIAIWILNIALAGAEYIFRGIIVKGLIIFYLVKGIGYAKDAEELRKRINNR